MMRSFTIETDQPDCEGTVINLEGIEIPDRVPLLYNFHATPDKVITFGRVWVEGSELKCEANLDEMWLDTYPAISFTMDKYSVNPGGKLVKQCRLRCIGLCDDPNLNLGIKTIREQIVNSFPS